MFLSSAELQGASFTETTTGLGATLIGFSGTPFFSAFDGRGGGGITKRRSSITAGVETGAMAAFVGNGRLADFFSATFFTGFLATFLATFLTTFLATFLTAFLRAFLAIFLAGLLAVDFFPAFFTGLFFPALLEAGFFLFFVATARTLCRY